MNEPTRPCCALCEAPGDFGPTDPRKPTAGLCPFCAAGARNAVLTLARRRLAAASILSPERATPSHCAEHFTLLGKSLRQLIGFLEAECAAEEPPAEEARRCPAAHAEDPTPCGDSAPDAVTVRDMHGGEVTGCVHHTARMFASITGARVLPGPGGRDGDATAALRASLELSPFCWLRGGESR
ncbi:hypothetical protein [Streptomyces aidingensis]|uniref:Uncharacterized protein n=1 Tax=Streptomyces aidingensis TaxID=910347 RepID=A0A1I1TZU7_9ACTN|nr:hypothetical protein [Streptomyces aidingensis]SFD61953.1 hypothetical protein SAMN05421773_12129 [Streptomyces aidingensis]